MNKYVLGLFWLLFLGFQVADIQAQISSDSTEVKEDKPRKNIRKRSSSDDKKYVIKVDPLYLLVRQPYFYYEDALSKRASLQWEASFQVPWRIKSDVYGQILQYNDTMFRSKPASFTGFSLGLAYKYYLTSKKMSAPQGTYLAPYFRYMNYNLTAPKLTTPGTQPQTTIDWKVVTALEGWRVGLMFGRQWAFRNGLTFDLMLVGVSYGPYLISMRGTTEDSAQFDELKSMSNKFIQELEARTTAIKVKMDSKRDQVKVVGQYWTAMPRLQSAITIGYSFN